MEELMGPIAERYEGEEKITVSEMTAIAAILPRLKGAFEREVAEEAFWRGKHVPTEREVQIRQKRAQSRYNRQLNVWR